MGITSSRMFQRFYERYSRQEERYRGQELVATADPQTAFVLGIQTLHNVVSILTKTNINSSTSAFKVKRIVKRLSLPIRHTHEYLSRALQMWLEENDKLSEEIEKTVDDMGKMKQNLSEKKIKIKELNQNLKSLNDQIDNKEQELRDAKSSLNRANDTLADSQEQLRKKKQEQKTVAIVGVVITAIPIIGWIAGPTMIIVSLTALEDAVKEAGKNVDSARENIKDCESKISQKKTSQNDLRQQLSRKNTDKDEMEERLEKIEESVRGLQEKQKRFLEVGEKLKNTCHFMTKIWGKSNVLKTETQDHAYALEPLFTPLKEIAEMFTFEEQNKLKMTTLLSKDIDFASMSLKMKAICEKTEDKSLEILDDYV